MVNREVLFRRIEKVKEYLDYLYKIKENCSIDDFKHNPMIYASSERFLHLSIEALLDIGTHVISDENLGKVEFYSDIPKLLHQHGYLTKELTDLFIKIIGFRNILVHEYLEIDLDIVYNVMKNSLNDLEKILKEMAKIL